MPFVAEELRGNVNQMGCRVKPNSSFVSICFLNLEQLFAMLFVYKILRTKSLDKMDTCLLVTLGT